MTPKRHVKSVPSGERRRRVQSPQKGWVTEAMTPIFAAAVLVAVAVGDLAAIVGPGRFERHFGVDAGDYLFGGYDFVETPAVEVAHIPCIR